MESFFRDWRQYLHIGHVLIQDLLGRSTTVTFSHARCGSYPDFRCESFYPPSPSHPADRSRAGPAIIAQPADSSFRSHSLPYSCPHCLPLRLTSSPSWTKSPSCCSCLSALRCSPPSSPSGCAATTSTGTSWRRTQASSSPPTRAASRATCRMPLRAPPRTTPATRY